MTDRPDLSNAFEAAGIKRDATEHLAGTILDAIRANVARKADLDVLRANLDVRFASLEGKINLLYWMLSFVLAMQVTILFRLSWH